MSLIAENVLFYASGGNQYSSDGVKVCKFNIVSDQWLDPSTFRVMFTIHNNNPVSPPIKVKPLHWNPAVLFRRCRVICGGVVIEDIGDLQSPKFNACSDEASR